MFYPGRVINSWERHFASFSLCFLICRTVMLIPSRHTSHGCEKSGVVPASLPFSYNGWTLFHPSALRWFCLDLLLEHLFYLLLLLPCWLTFSPPTRRHVSCHKSQQGLLLSVWGKVRCLSQANSGIRHQNGIPWWEPGAQFPQWDHCGYMYLIYRILGGTGRNGLCECAKYILDVQETPASFLLSFLHSSNLISVSGPN